jgi:ATP phosphoribosyltransferase regulatory subunit HisZ
MGLFCFTMDDALTIEALNLADGSDIHDVAGMVGIYRSLVQSRCDSTELETELRRFVLRKRLQRTINLSLGKALYGEDRSTPQGSRC